MKTDLFRKKSIDKIQSPDELDCYLKVTNPGVWILIVAMICLLIGAIVWGIFGNMDSSFAAVIEVSGGEATVYFSPEAADGIAVGNAVRAGGAEGAISSLDLMPHRLEEVEDTFEYYALTAGIYEWYCSAKAEIDLDDGIYECKVVTESFRPIRFIFN